MDRRGDRAAVAIVKTLSMAALAAASVAALSGCAAPDTAPAPAIPARLVVPATQELSLKTKAVGVQIYECAADRDDATRFEWVFRAPEATLLDAKGNRVGVHYAGPTWEANDGSKVLGEVKARDDGPDATAIPWLLLAAKSATGKGPLARTTSVQRILTVGGKAPGDGCGPAQAGREIRVPYEAAYYFYAAAR